MSKTYSEVSNLLHTVEKKMIEEHHPVYNYYKENLANSSKFNNELDSLFKKCYLLQKIDEENGHSLLTDNSFYEILWYAYLMPFEKLRVSGIPDYYEECDLFLKYYNSRIYNKRYYYIHQMDVIDGDIRFGKVSLTDYVTKNKSSLLKKSGQAKSIPDLILYTKNAILDWGMMSDDYKTSADGYLINYPLISELSIANKKSFFLLDVGYVLFYMLDEIGDSGDYVIFPSAMLQSQIVGLSSSKVKPSVNYNESKLQIEMASKRTIYEVISLANDLAEIDNSEARRSFIDQKLAKIKEENRTFPNVTSRDFVGLSNILRAFFKTKAESGDSILRTTLGDLTDIVLSGNSSNHIKRHRKEAIINALNILQKWTSYSFDLGWGKGYLTPFNYVSGEYASSPKLLAQAISNYSGGYQNRLDVAKEDAVSSLPDISLNSSNLEDIPIHIEISQLFFRAIEHNLMERAFYETYEMVQDANTKVVYSFIEAKRLEASSTDRILITKKEIESSFDVSKPYRFYPVFRKSLDELRSLGAIVGWDVSFKTGSYQIDFRNSSNIS